jgi:hypothetical protein
MQMAGNNRSAFVLIASAFSLLMIIVWGQETLLAESSTGAFGINV